MYLEDIVGLLGGRILYSEPGTLCVRLAGKKIRAEAASPSSPPFAQESRLKVLDYILF